MKEVNNELKKYIEENIFPEYHQNEAGHNLDHIKDVIRRSFNIVASNNLDVNKDMVYTIAAYHDIGHHIDSKTHEIISAEILAADKNLLKFFSPEEINVMSEAVADHRASSDHDPRSIYGKIVSTADRNNTVEQCLRRSYCYGKKLSPNATDEELFANAHDVLTRKFGENGYAKFFFKDEEYESFLKSLRALLKDKEVFCKTQKEYIEKLKAEHKI